jgi:hypothetical protein
MNDDLGWMELHLRCLYHHDSKDRILQTRQPGGLLCPLFHLGRTPLGNLWRFREDLEPNAVRELSRLVGKEGPLPLAHPPPERMQAIRSVVGSVTEIVFEWRGPAFRFPEQIPLLPLEPGEPEVLAVEPGMESLLEEFFVDWTSDIATCQPMLAAVEGGRAVSLCHAARPRVVDGSPICLASEVGVETAPSHRGRGLAPRVVAAWGRAVRKRGGQPMYSTSWDNKASRAVARKLGLVFYGEDLHFS